MVNLNVTLEEGPQGNHSYHAGHQLKGLIELTTSKKLTTRGLYVEVIGKAKTKFTTRSGKTTTFHKGDELYINSRSYLIGENGGPKIEIAPGVHKYNYSFDLPSELPDSLKLPHGEVKYYVRAVLDIPWAFNQKVKIPITIISLSDLNLYTYIKAPKNVEFTESFLSFSGNFEPFKMVVSLPFTGFVADQEVPFTISYSNGSSVEVKKTRMKLKQEITYTSTSKSHSKVDSNDIELPVLQGVKPHSNENITASFRVPPLLPTFDELCKIITISYSLNIKAEVGAFHTAPKISIPIIIGTIPIGADGIYTPTAPVKPLGPIEPSAPLNGEKDLPPPFEVAVNLPKA